MLWRHFVNTGQKQSEADPDSKSVARCMDIQGRQISLPPIVCIKNKDTGELLLQIPEQDFSFNPDIDFWYQKAREMLPANFDVNLYIDFSGII